MNTSPSSFSSSSFSFSTPMMKQYREIKIQYPDCLLFYRMGDFYELFMEDAHIGAEVLNITLTKKAGGKDGKIPMAGVPYHAVDTYLAKLVKAGYKVAICEQLSPPNKRGLVERDVVRIVTPGTVLDEKILDKKQNNYIVSIAREGIHLGISIADLSTGFFATTEFQSAGFDGVLRDELSRFHPSECILSDELYNDPDLLKVLRVEPNLNIFPYKNWDTYVHDPQSFLCDHFNIATLESFGVSNGIQSLNSAAALLGYLRETQKGTVGHIKKIASLSSDDRLILDRSSMINLELFSTIRDHDSRGSLLSVLDRTTTAMGGRLLKQWMTKPLVDQKSIEDRLDAVQTLIEHAEFRERLCDLLGQIPDIERLVSRLSVGLGNARDLVNLRAALVSILQVKALLKEVSTSLLDAQSIAISADLEQISSMIATMIVDEPPISLREGGLIKSDVSTDLDSFRKRISKSKQWILDLEKSEKERTGIGSLKVRFNKVFGFYIEISKSNLHAVPDDYMRKQTLVNGERYITAELKHHEEIILTAEEKINELEYSLFLKIVEDILSYTHQMQAAAESIGVIDCISNFAQIAEKGRYIRPGFTNTGEISMIQARHPVVETLLDTTPFVPNDVVLNGSDQSLLLITGPNMAGKSVYIRQVALLVLMAQMGCFIPAERATISIVDRIFVRSGASDVITSGLSTFMVEMVETAHILNNATEKSLIIMDEIGRGTSTYDGISIAWAVAEFLVSKINPAPKTLFATHYHELQALEDQFPSIKNFHMAVANEHGQPIFLHTILPGGASHSFGVAVAKLAGVPESVVQRAQEILKSLDTRSLDSNHIQQREYPVSNTDIVDHLLHKELEHLDIAGMTPLEALNKLAELKDKLKLLQTSSPEYTEVD